MAAEFDVLVATVGQRDVAQLPLRPGRTPPVLKDFRHQIFKTRLANLRAFGMQASEWLEETDPVERRARARDTDLPLLDPVLVHLAREAADPPAVLLVATDQPDDVFRRGDTIELARFIKAVLAHRDDGRTTTVDVVEVPADPTDPIGILGVLDGLVERVCATAPGEPVRVGLATTGGTPAITAVVTMLLAAAATGSTSRAAHGRLHVTELRVGPTGRVDERGLADVLALLGLEATGAR